MSHTKQLWPGLTVNVDNGSAASVKDFLNVQNYKGTIKCQLSIQKEDSKTGTLVWKDYFWDKFSPFASTVTKPSQNEKTPSDAKNESQQLIPCPEVDTCKMCERFCNNVLQSYDPEKFNIGTRVFVDPYGTGRIDDLPVDGMAWVKFDTDPDNSVRGIKIERLQKMTDEKKELGVNPKDILGIKKVQLDLVPMTSIIYQAYAMEDGAKKYGPYNWRDTKVQASIYHAAAKRHLDLWFNGEEYTDDTGVPNLGAALACIGILIDAKIAGTLADNRPKSLDPVVMNALLKRSEVKKPE